MKILITGGAGFLGNALTIHLSKTKSNLLSVLDNHVHGFPVKFPKKKNIESHISGNVRNLYDIRRTIDRISPEVVIHLASHDTRPESLGDFRECAEVNYVGTANILDACVYSDFRPRRIIFASSDAVLHPNSHFGISKLAAESLLESVCSQIGISYIGLRFSEIYGYGSPFTSKCQINFLVDRMLRGDNIALYSVNKKRDYIHLSDAVRALDLSITTEHNILNKIPIGSDECISTKELVNKLRILTKHEGQLKFLEDPDVTILDYKTDTKIAEKVLGFTNEKDLDEGLKELVSKRKKDLK